MVENMRNISKLFHSVVIQVFKGKYYIFFIMVLVILLGIISWILAAEAITWNNFIKPNNLTIQQKSVIALIFSFFLAFIPFVSWMWLQRNKMYIFPFKNFTNDEKYAGITAGFTDLLRKEYNEVCSLREIMDATMGREFSPLGIRSMMFKEKRPRIIPPFLMGFKDTAFPKIELSPGVDMTVSIQSWDLKLGPITLSLGGLLNLTLSAFQQKRISGNFQKHGSILDIYVNLTGKEGGSWKMQSKNLSEEVQSENQLFYEFAHGLAYKIVWNIKEGPGDKPQSFQFWTSGLDHFWSYINSNLTAIHELYLAQNDLEKSCEINPRFLLAHIHLGLVYNELGLINVEQNKIRDAIEQFTTVLDLDSTNAQAHFHLACAYSIVGFSNPYRKIEMLDKSLKECKEALKNQPNYIAAQQKCAELNKEAADTHLERVQWMSEDEGKNEIIKVKDFYHEAISAYSWLIKKNEQDLIKSLFLFTANAQNHVIEHDKLKYTISVALDDLSEVYYSLGILDSIEHKNNKVLFKKAEQALNKAIKSNPENMKARIHMGRMYINQGNFDKYIQNYFEALQIEPENLDIKRENSTVLLYASEQTLLSIWEQFQSEKNIMLDKIIQDEYKPVKTWKEFLKTCIKTFTELLINEPTDIQMLYDLAYAHLLLGRYYIIFSGRHRYLKYRHLQAMKEFNDAISLVGKVLVLNPLDYTAYRRLELIYQDKQRIGHAYDYKIIAQTYHNIADLIFSYNENPDVLIKKLDDNLNPLVDKDEKWIYLWTKGWLLIYFSIYHLYDENKMKDGLRCLEEANPSLYLFDWNDIPVKQIDVLRSILKDKFDIDWMKRPKILKSNDDRTIQIFENEMSVEFINDTKIEKATLKIGEDITYYLNVKKKNDTYNIYIDQLIEAEQIHYYLGLIYIGQNNQDKGIDELAKALSGNPLNKTYDFLMDLAEAYNKYGHYDKAIECYSEVILLYENDNYNQAAAFVSRAAVYLAKKEFIEAIKDCQQASELVPLNALPHFIMGQVHFQRMEYILSIKSFERVVDLKPQQLLAPSHRFIANANRYLGEGCDDVKQQKDYFNKAIQHYKKSLILYNPNEPQLKSLVHADMALVLVKLERYNEAKLECDRALVLSDDSEEPELLLAVADVYVKCKRFLNAERAYKSAIRLIRKELLKAKTQNDDEIISSWALILADVYNDLTYYIYAEQGEVENHKKGLDCIEQAINALNDIKDETIKKEKEGYYLDTRALLYYKLERYNDAISDLKRAISLTLGTQEERTHLAIVYEAVAKAASDEDKAEYLKQAKAQWEQVKDLDDKSSWGKKAIQKLNQFHRNI